MQVIRCRKEDGYYHPHSNSLKVIRKSIKACTVYATLRIYISTSVALTNTRKDLPDYHQFPVITHGEAGRNSIE